MTHLQPTTIAGLLNDGHKPIFLLGAGASVGSGVPLAGQLVESIAKFAYCKATARVFDDPTLMRSDWYRWLEQRPWFSRSALPADLYPTAVEALLQPSSVRKEFFQSILRRALEPSVGYQRLVSSDGEALHYDRPDDELRRSHRSDGEERPVGRPLRRDQDAFGLRHVRHCVERPTGDLPAWVRRSLQRQEPGQRDTEARRRNGGPPSPSLARPPARHRWLSRRRAFGDAASASRAGSRVHELPPRDLLVLSKGRRSTGRKPSPARSPVPDSDESALCRDRGLRRPAHLRR